MPNSRDVIDRRFFALVLVKRLRGLNPLGGALLGRLLGQYQALVHILQGCSSLERGFRLISSHLVLYQVLVLLVPRNAHNVFAWFVVTDGFQMIQALVKILQLTQ